MNYDALRDAKVAESTVKAIANKFGLPHAYCDPDEVQRAERNIIGKGKLEGLKWLNEWSEDEFIKHLRNDYEKRERFWIENYFIERIQNHV
jgi:hypothetical protein